MEIKNPISIKNIGDPYVLNHNGTYYLYATSNFNGYYCWQSDNLSDWSEPVVCYEATEKSFGNGKFWAPEVYEFDGKFYMYYTADWKIYPEENLRIGVAVSNSPTGPFEDVFDNKPMFDFGYGVLDAHILNCKDGKFLFYSKAGYKHFVDGFEESQMFVIELCDDYISVKGEPKLILRPEEEWERKQPEIKQVWNEGGFVVEHDGKYHLMYSANFFTSPYYCIGAAVAKHPMGPYVKYDNNPIMQTSKTISGPGHNSVVKDKNGTYYCVYHAHTDYNKPSGNRQVYISELNFVNDKICVNMNTQ